MPDIGSPPPHPPDVSAQMKPSGPPMGPDMGSMLGQFAGAQPQVADIGMQVIQVEPLLNQLARQIPSLAPATDQLLGEMKFRMGAPAMGIAALIGGMMGGPGSGSVPGMQPPGMPAPGPGETGAVSPLSEGPPPPFGAPPAAAPPPAMGMGAPPMGAPDPGMGMQPQATDSGAGTPGGPIALPPAPPEMGLMDIAMQLEVQLPGIGAQDPTLLPEIQFFIAKMREEVPRALSGSPETQAASLQSGNLAPTDMTLKAIPSLA